MSRFRSRRSGAALPLLCLALAGLARAQEAPAGPGEVTLEGTLDGQAVSARLAPPRGERPISLTLGGGWSGSGRQVSPSTWRLDLSRPTATVGLAGRVRGQQGGGAPAAELSLLLTRSANDLSGVLYRGGRQVGVLRGRVSTPRPVEVQSCEVTRDALYARHLVAGWGLVRAFWDFYKPGSRRLEELRADQDQARTRALHERLTFAPRPLTPVAIFAAARAQAQDDRQALQLSFAYVIDHPELELAQLPGIESDDIHDKYAHYFASAILAHRSNARGSFTVGWAKEVLDEVSGSGYSEDDLMADALGAEFGQSLLCGGR